MGDGTEHSRVGGSRGRPISNRNAFVSFIAALGSAVAVATPISARAQFTNLWAFGDSFADQGNAANLLNQSGAPYPSHVPGAILYHTYPFWLQSLYTIPSAQYTNYAIDGATSSTLHIRSPNPFLFGFTTEIQIFAASQQRIPPNNLVTISIGLNDPGVYGPFLYAPQAAAQATANVYRGVQTLIAAGGRTFAIAGFSNDAAFPQLGVPSNFPAYLVEYSADYYRGLQASLASLSQPGVRFFLFDESRMFQQVAANPAAYGFSSGTITCDAVPACAADPNSPLQFQYLSYDGLHLTSGGFLLEARYIANQLGAPNSVPAQTALAQIGATSFANAIFGRLDAYRWQGPGSLLAGSAVATGSASPWSVYLQGLGTFGSRDSRFGATGFNYSDGGVIFGAEYRVNPVLLLGLAFNYSNPTATLQQGGGSIGVNQYQLAGYASYTDLHLFADALLAGSRNNLNASRPGVIDTIQASPSGNSFVAGLNSGYLFDTAAFRVGPILGLTYAASHEGSYTESGDPLITQMVANQHESSLVGDAGIQARFPMVLGNGALLSPNVNLVAERNVLGNSRVLTTAFTAAPGLPIYSIVGGSGTGTYGRLTAELAGNFSPRLSMAVQGGLTFARPGGNDYGVDANLTYRF